MIDVQCRNYNIVNESIQKIGRFEVHVDTISINDNKYPFSYVSIRNGVTVLPVINDKVVAIRQFRYPIKQWMLELPGGVIDENEEPEEAAVRELREETGYYVKNIIPMGTHYPSYGATDEKVYLYVAICDKKSAKDLEETELIENIEIPILQFEQYIKNGNIQHSSAIILWYRYKEYLLRGKNE